MSKSKIYLHLHFRSLKDYHLSSHPSPAICISMDVVLLIQSCLSHPSLSQKMVPHFSTLSSLACEFCHLRKHIHISFPKRLNNRTKVAFVF